MNIGTLYKERCPAACFPTTIGLLPFRCCSEFAWPVNGKQNTAVNSRISGIFRKYLGKLFNNYLAVVGSESVILMGAVIWRIEELESKHAQTEVPNDRMLDSHLMVTEAQALRDRIAAFEKPSTSNEPTRAPPPLRPRPAGDVSWKPKPPSPPVDTPAFAEGAGASNEGEAGAAKSGMGGQMSLSNPIRTTLILPPIFVSHEELCAIDADGTVPTNDEMR
ncbi:hypothetical protein B0H13DRAFT_1932580 [Mycena leptocephala]|nr:hypothetical protein B0H13DRAFT_1932580 [Mycena leptocephala]